MKKRMVLVLVVLLVVTAGMPSAFAYEDRLTTEGKDLMDEVNELLLSDEEMIGHIERMLKIEKSIEEIMFSGKAGQEDILNILDDIDEAVEPITEDYYEQFMDYAEWLNEKVDKGPPFKEGLIEESSETLTGMIIQFTGDIVNVMEEVTEEHAALHDVSLESITDDSISDEMLQAGLDYFQQGFELGTEFRIGESSGSIAMQIGNNLANVNGQTIELDQAPVIENGRTLVPLRFVGESLGAEIDWNPDTREVTYSMGDTTIRLRIDSHQARINGNVRTMDAAPTIQNGRTLVPVRFVSEALGMEVDWDGETQTVTIH